MKKTNKRILSGFGIFILLLVFLFVDYLLTARSIMKGMTTVETVETVKNVFSIKDTFANLYLVQIGDQYVAIDAGNDKGFGSAHPPSATILLQSCTLILERRRHLNFVLKLNIWSF